MLDERVHDSSGIKATQYAGYEGVTRVDRRQTKDIMRRPCTLSLAETRFQSEAAVDHLRHQPAS